MFLARYAKNVNILIRGDSLKKRMSTCLIDQINNTGNIKVWLRTEIDSLHGDDRLEAITLRNNETGTGEKVSADALFIFIGAVPHSDFVAGVVKRNEAGFIYTGPDLLRAGNILRRSDI